MPRAETEFLRLENLSARLRTESGGVGPFHLSRRVENISFHRLTQALAPLTIKNPPLCRIHLPARSKHFRPSKYLPASQKQTPALLHLAALSSKRAFWIDAASALLWHGVITCAWNEPSIALVASRLVGKSPRVWTRARALIAECWLSLRLTEPRSQVTERTAWTGNAA